MKLDLHIHTNNSDSPKSIKEVIHEAKQLGLNTISITDHDIINSITNIGINIISGIELSCIHNKGLFHVLGYHVDPTNQALQDIALKNITSEVNNNTLKDNIFIKEYMSKYALDLQDYNSFQEEAKPIAGKQFISKAQNYLIAKGYCHDRRDFFKRLVPELFPNGMRFELPQFVSPQESISAIKQAGGYAVIAHPFKRSQKLSLLDTLKLFTELGIDGVECFHPDANDEITSSCLDWCKNNDLYITGGSDYHGGRFGRKLGSLGHNTKYLNLPLKK